MKQHKLKLSSEEMKAERANATRGDHLKCENGRDALNCPEGTQFRGTIPGSGSWPIGIMCESGSRIIEYFCPGTSGTIDNDVDACAGKDSGADCTWTESGVSYSGTCQFSQSHVLYCKKKS